MSKSRSRSFLDKSISAALSAIEVYNKPDFKYREETFSILMVNAWELLLKARVLALNGNKLGSICAWEHRSLKSGKKGRRRVVRRNRSGNPMTIGIPRALDILIDSGETVLLGPCQQNVLVLMEIRDNAIHFRHDDAHLGRKVQEIGTASLRNYLALVSRWFDYDMSRYNFYLMPLSFYHEFESAVSHSVHPPSQQLANLLAYIAEQETTFPSDEEKEFNISLRLETRFVKTPGPDAVPFARVGTPSHITINLSEEEALKKFPLDYDALTTALRRRYSDFAVNEKYHTLRKQLADDSRYCRTRLLDPSRPKGLRKQFFSSEIIKQFDLHYTRR